MNELKEKKICVINNLYSPYNRGGTDRIAKIITDELKKLEYKIITISLKPYFKKTIPNPENSKQNKISKNYYLNSLFFYLKNIPKSIRLIWHIWDIFNFINYFKIKKILKNEKIDIAITHNLKGIGLLIPKLLKKLNIKHIHYLHDIQLLHPSGLMICGKENIIENELSKIYQKICSKLFNSPNTIISPSKWLLNLHIKKNFFEKSKKNVLLNPINNQMSTENKNINLGLGKINLLYVGEIEEQKGILFLIKTIKKLKKEKKNIILNIIGKGSKLEKLKKEKIEYIKILGWKKNKEVIDYMVQSDALITPSICYENSPTVIYEAINKKIPVIASRIGGITELIHYLGGVLFESNNENDLIDKIKWVIKNKQKIINKYKKDNLKNLEAKNYIKKLENLINLL